MNDPKPVEPILVPIAKAIDMSGLSRSELYRRLAAGDIAARKSGSRTLISVDSLRAHLAALPAAEFGRRPSPNRKTCRLIAAGNDAAAQIAA